MPVPEGPAPEVCGPQALLAGHARQPPTVGSVHSVPSPPQVAVFLTTPGGLPPSLPPSELPHPPLNLDQGEEYREGNEPENRKLILGGIVIF